MLRIVHSSADGGQERSLDDEALNWVVRLTSGETSEDDHETFRAWRDQSRDHAEALARARRLWSQVGTALPQVGRRRGWGVFGSAGRHIALAASLLLCLGLGQQYLSVWRFDQVTAHGERRIVRLPDGSRLVMAGDTALDLHYSNKVRRVDLARGQALFEVRHDERQPFVVHTDESTVRDVGTVFDMQRREGSTRVTVVQGLVEASTNDMRTLLRRDQTLSVSAAGPGHVQALNGSEAASWTSGRLFIRDRPLNEIVSTLKPHYSGSIYLLNGAAGRRRLSAVVNLNNIDGWLNGLAVTQSLSLSRVGGIVILR